MKWFLSLFIVGFISQEAFSFEGKVAFVDVKKVIQTVKEGKKAKLAMEKFFKKRNKQLEAQAKALQRKTEDLKKKKLVLSSSAYAQRVQEHEKARSDYEKNYAQAQVELQKKERELTLPILKKINRVAQKLSVKEKFTVVLNKDVVIWADKTVDITGKVIKMYSKVK